MTIKSGATYRATDYNPSAPRLKGYALRWNAWAVIDNPVEGRFRERFAPGAFNDAIREDGPNVAILYGHGHGPIGDMPLGKLVVLGDDGIGPKYDVAMTDTSFGRDIAAGVGDGLYGASVRFAVRSDQYTARPARTKENPTGIPERTVLNAGLREISITPFPAYRSSSATLDGAFAPRALSLEDEYALRAADDSLFWFTPEPKRSRQELRGWRRREKKIGRSAIRWHERDVKGKPGTVLRVFESAPWRDTPPR